MPLDSIVAVLNGDMIGRNNPDSAALARRGAAAPQLVGAGGDGARGQPAHRATSRSTARGMPRRIPKGWYFRSDHLPYARAGVPAIFFTTLLHPDYHTPRDEPERIDIGKLTKMTRWMYVTGWLVANAPQRPALDPGFRLER